jgi:hypothetical protein
MGTRRRGPRPLAAFEVVHPTTIQPEGLSRVKARRSSNVPPSADG